jgi:hypothetical protein
MQGGAGGHFQGLQFQAVTLASRSEDYWEKGLDLPRDLLMNDSSRFFSASVQPVSSGSTVR